MHKSGQNLVTKVKLARTPVWCYFTNIWVILQHWFTFFIVSNPFRIVTTNFQLLTPTPPPCQHACICVHMRAHACTCVHMRAYSCTCVHMRAYSCICLHMRAYACICVHMRAYWCICVHIGAYACTYVHIRAYACIFVHMRAYFCICVHMRAYSCICVHMRAHTSLHAGTSFKPSLKWYPWELIILSKKSFYNIASYIIPVPSAVYHLKMTYWKTKSKLVMETMMKIAKNDQSLESKKEKK